MLLGLFWTWPHFVVVSYIEAKTVTRRLFYGQMGAKVSVLGHMHFHTSLKDEMKEGGRE